jgi:hypothetical protein
MRIPKASVDPNNNAYLLGIAQRLKVDPHRVACNVRIGPGGGLLVDVAVDGRNPTGPEEKIIAEYLEEAFHGIKPRVVEGV